MQFTYTYIQYHSVWNGLQIVWRIYLDHIVTPYISVWYSIYDFTGISPSLSSARPNSISKSLLVPAIVGSMPEAAFAGAPLGATALYPRTLRTSPPLCSKPCVRPVQPGNGRQRGVRMGLFGLGLPELAVIAGVGIFIFGPKKISELGKDLGSIAGSVKKATGEFQEAMEESLKEADEELEQKKRAKEAAAKTQAVDAATTTVEKVEPEVAEPKIDA